MGTVAGVYARISSDPDETRLGVGRQEKDCRELAQRKGWEVVDTFIDNDLSAATSKPRPEYQRLLTAIEAGDIDAVIVWDLDRLHRRPIEHCTQVFRDVAEGRYARRWALCVGAGAPLVPLPSAAGRRAGGAAHRVSRTFWDVFTALVSHPYLTSI
jgi:hypothetical protein